MSFINTVHETVINYKLWNFTSPLVLAVSGGRDSMVMMHVLSQLIPNPQYLLHIAHINHSARQSSKIDAQFVLRESQKLGLNYSLKNISPWNSQSGESMESYWRRKRYEALHSIRTEINASAIATAHTASDHIETIIYRLITGCGPRGLLGIRSHRSDHIIRPMLGVTRNEITDFSEQNGIQYLDDPGNKDLTKPRNAIRQKIIPALESINPEAARNTRHLSDLLETEDRLLSQQSLDHLSKAGWKNTVPAILKTSVFENAPLCIIRRCAAALYDIVDPEFRPEFKHISRLSLCFRGQLKFCPLPGSGAARLEKDLLIITPPEQENRRITLTETGKSSIQYAGFYGIVIEKVLKQNPAQNVIKDDGLRVRTRKPGDYVIRESGTGSLSLSEHFRIQGMPVCLRDHLPLLAGQNGEIKWIAHPENRSDILIESIAGDWIRLTCFPRSAIRWSLLSQ